jgi:hypothetical protein
VVTQGQIASLATGFARTWQRPPTREELQGLVRDHVREEVYCREAIDLGLDNDDAVIRRRLRQKMEFVSDDVAARTEPTETDLEAYLAAHAESFRLERRITFRQVFLNPERHGTHLAADAQRLLDQLNRPGSKADLGTVGDPFLLEHSFQAVPASEIAKQFGEAFATKLAELPLGGWQGPVASGYGAHLVSIADRTEGGIPPLDAVRDAVRREWENARRLDANEAFYQGLLKQYAVTIETVPPPEGEKKLAEAQR